MGSVHRVTAEGTSLKALAEINSTNHAQPVNPAPHEVRNNEGSEEDESQVNGPEIVQNGHAGPGEASQMPGPQSGAQHQGQQQPPLGPRIPWQRFLAVKTLKVLLVENDDSTRHIVTALLRSCSYDVITAANGLQAWTILQDLTNPIDLVLTEVVLPCLSGIGLLSKIKSHKTCKNIPVIMMSSNDSMGTVFECLSKGAVHFLVKPIRKNELKILWQHVWRCHSSSGSGSKSGIQMQEGAKSNSGEDSDNNSSSSGEEENTSIRLNARDGSDNGSGTQAPSINTQSLWAKHAAEEDSPQQLSASDQLADSPDSTCAQAIHPTAENYCNGWLPIATHDRNHQAQKDCNDEFMGKDLEIGVPGNLNSEYPNEMVHAKLADGITDKTHDSSAKTDAVTDGSNMFDEPTTQAADLIGSIANSIGAQQAATRVGDTPNGFVKISDSKDKGCDGFAELPSLELSLKRLRSAGDGVNPPTDDRVVLRRSDSSAFTRYHTSGGASNQGTAGGYGGSCSLLDNSSQAVKTDLTHNMKSNSNSNNATLIKQGSNGSSNNNDMGSTTKNAFTNCPAPAKEKVSSPSALKNKQHTSAFRPVQIRADATAPAAVRQSSQDKSKEVTLSTTVTTTVVPGQGKEVYMEHHHHYHHIHHHFEHHGVQKHQPPVPPMEHSMPMGSGSVTGPPPQTIQTGPVEGQAANYSLNGSNSGSNGQNGGSTAVHANGVNVENANVMAEKSVAVNGNGNVSGSSGYQNRLSHREVALDNYKQKKLKRNFSRKVRYHSRKKLAEQRPRIRGQFVRQSVHHDQSGRDAES